MIITSNNLITDYSLITGLTQGNPGHDCKVYYLPVHNIATYNKKSQKTDPSRDNLHIWKMAKKSKYYQEMPQSQTK